MSQNREPPSYQEYPAAMMARREYRLMNLSERGLLSTMRYEAWVNKTLPADPSALAKMIGFNRVEVKNALPAVMPFFAVANGEIVCPELDDYRAYQKERRLKQSEGGKTGSGITNRKRKQSRKPKSAVPSAISPVTTTPAATSTSNSTSTPAASGRLLSTAKHSQDQSNPPLEKDSSSPDPWIDEYSAAESVMPGTGEQTEDES
jgi:uncharacterized protein YdaU (DUF1376 family)